MYETFSVRRLVLAGVGAGALVLSASVLAQGEPADSSLAPIGLGDMPSQQLGPISVTGVPLPGSPLSQAADVDVVPSDDVESKGSSNLGQALEDLAGVDNIGTGNVAGKPVIGGLSGERVKILSNGLGVDHNQFAVRHMPTYDPFLLDRVEVVRGASSVLYGSSALGGAINLLPPEINFDTPIEGETLTRYYSNNDQWDTGVKVTGGNGRFGYAVGIVRRSGEDIDTPDDRTYFPPPPRAGLQERHEDGHVGRFPAATARGAPGCARV